MNTKTNKFIKIVLGLGFAVLLLVGGTVSAQTSSSTPNQSPGIFDVRPRSDVTLLAPLPCLPGSPNCVNGVVTRINFADYLNLLFKLAIGLSGVFAVFMIVVGGFKYLSTDAISGKEEGKEMIWRALEGLIMVLASYFILYTINPQYVEFRSDIIKPICDPSDPNVDLRVACLQRSNQYVDLAVQLGEIARLANEEVQTLDRQAVDLRQQAETARRNGQADRANQLEAQARDIEIRSLNLWAANIGRTEYRLAVDRIRTPAGTTVNGVSMSQEQINREITAARERIERDYDTAIGGLSARGDVEGSIRLRAERYYYLTSLEDEQRAYTPVQNYRRLNNVTSQNNARLVALQLENNLEQNLRLMSSNPTLAEQYRTETQARIRYIRDNVPPTQAEINFANQNRN